VPFYEVPMPGGHQAAFRCSTGIVNLTTLLEHSSGEWIASERWPAPSARPRAFVGGQQQHSGFELISRQHASTRAKA
jgi:hypothetical protein